MCGAKGVLSSGSCLRRLVVGRSLVGVRRIFSILGGLVGLLGLSVASQKIAQAARTFHPPPSIYLVGPTAAGKTTLFRYLCHLPRPDDSASTGRQRRTGRLAADFSEGRRSWFRSYITDDGLGRQVNQWAGRLKRDNPEGMIVIVDTHSPDDDHTYLQDLYNSYGDVSTHADPVNLRIVLILLNKFDLWGRTTASREAMMQRYRTEVFPELVNRFRSRFGVTVQFGYASLTQPEHAPYNHLTLKEFLAALHQRAST
jgi:signal recognition particle receptor subunit beta